MNLISHSVNMERKASGKIINRLSFCSEHVEMFIQTSETTYLFIQLLDSFDIQTASDSNDIYKFKLPRSNTNFTLTIFVSKQNFL